MDPDRWRRIEDALDRFLDLEEPVDVEVAVRALCRDDPDILGEVMDLARAAGRPGGALEAPLLESAPDLMSELCASLEEGLEEGLEGGDMEAGGERIVGSYRLLEIIGRGGMGVVYLAERADGQFEKRVAVKLMPRGLETPGMERRFRAERQILADLDHPGIARLLDGGVTDEGYPFLVMELVEGRTLSEEIRAGAVSLERFFELAIPLAQTLEVAHRYGIIHRDLKPANIMVTPSGSPKVLDFGVAKRGVSDFELGAGAPRESLSEFTRDDRMVGTVPYMSPEQIRSEEVDSRADLFSLGVILFELVANRRPFRGDSVADLISSILEESAPDLAALRPEFPEPVVALIGRCLTKDREERIASASDLRRRLEALQKTCLDPSPFIDDDPTPSGAHRRSDLDPRAVAVLPFAKLSDIEEVGFLADGLHIDLITELSKIPGLTVISRTSVMAYRNTEKSAREIGRELGVGTLIEGSVQSVSGRVRLTAQLVDAVVDSHRWAEQYDRELSADTLFSLQSELTRRIVDSLHAELSSGDEAGGGKRQTGDLEAYRLRTLGRMQLDRRIEEGVRRAIDHFEQAVERDPDYALAWVGLADALALMVSYGYAEPDVLLSRAKEAAGRALELDPNSAAAHASLGLYYAMIQDGPATMRELELAVQIQPSYAEAHNWLCYYQILMGQSLRPLESARRAVELNPLSAEAVSNLSLSLLIQGENEDALSESIRIAELSPGWATADLYKGLALYQLRRYRESKEVLSGLTVEWTGLGAQASLALVLLRLGEESEARELLAEVSAAKDPFAVGLVLLALGDSERSFEQLAKVAKVRDWASLVIHHLYSDLWDTVRDDPRYDELVRHAYTSWNLDPPPPNIA